MSDFTPEVLAQARAEMEKFQLSPQWVKMMAEAAAAMIRFGNQTALTIAAPGLCATLRHIRRAEGRRALAMRRPRYRSRRVNGRLLPLRKKSK